jgi:hypothetical protein
LKTLRSKKIGAFNPTDTSGREADKPISSLLFLKAGMCWETLFPPRGWQDSGKGETEALAPELVMV